MHYCKHLKPCHTSNISPNYLKHFSDLIRGLKRGMLEKFCFSFKNKIIGSLLITNYRTD